METNLRCILCNACFLTKPKYEYHSIFCRWRHAPPKSRESEYDRHEKQLTDNQRDRLLRDLLYKVDQMTTEIQELKKKVSHLSKREKIDILERLQSNVPEQTFREWIGLIPITVAHLEKVFHSDLVQGICESLKDTIDSSHNLPVCAFIQNKKTIYIYRETLTKAWVILDKEECKKMIHILANRFFKLFIQWQQDHAHLSTNPEWQEKEMIYSKKIIGQEVCVNTRTQRIYDWIHSYIQKREPDNF